MSFQNVIVSLFLTTLVTISFGNEVHAKDRCGILHGKKASFKITAEIDEIALKMTEVYGVPVCAESVPIFCWELWLEGSWCDGTKYPTIEIHDLTLSEALDKLTNEVDQRYVWKAWKCKVVNIYPRWVEGDPDYPMNFQVSNLQFNNANVDYIISTVSSIVSSIICTEIEALPLVWLGSVGLPTRDERSDCPHSSQDDCIRFWSDEQSRIWSKKFKDELNKRRSSFRLRSGTVRDVMNEMVVHMNSPCTCMWHSKPLFLYIDGRRRYMCGYDGEYHFQVGVDLVDRVNEHKDYPATRFEPGRVVDIFGSDEHCPVFDIVKELLIDDLPVEDAVRVLSYSFGVPVHFESVYWHCRFDTEQCSNRNRVTMRGKFTLRQALAELVLQEQRYHWRGWGCRAVNVFPRHEAANPYYLMNLKVDELELQGKTMPEFLEDLIYYLRLRFRVVCLQPFNDQAQDQRLREIGWPGTGQSQLFKRQTVREILNEIFDKFDGKMSWNLHRFIILRDEEARKNRCNQEARAVLVPAFVGLDNY